MQAVLRLEVGLPDVVLVDGLRVPAQWKMSDMSKITVEPVVHGDAQSLSIAAASILAKVSFLFLLVTAHEEGRLLVLTRSVAVLQ